MRVVLKTMQLAKFNFFLIFFGIASLGCAGSKFSEEIPTDTSPLSNATREELATLASSVVGIHTEIEYEVHSDDGQGGMNITTDRQTISGGGLIIQVDWQSSRYVILTSKHLIDPEDTTDIFYLDENGAQTDVLFARYIVRDVSVSVYGMSNPPSPAQVIAVDHRYDMALVEVETANVLGFEFPNRVGYEENLSWGDWVFLFGFPGGIKQMTGGLVSPSPYSKKLAVDAVVRSGYSGGPVFAFSRKSENLVLAGVIESVPATTLDFVAPDRPLPKGYRLGEEDLESLVVEQKKFVDPGTVYFLTTRVIKDFFRTKRSTIETAGIHLDVKYYNGKATPEP